MHIPLLPVPPTLAVRTCTLDEVVSGAAILAGGPHRVKDAIGTGNGFGSSAVCDCVNRITAGRHLPVYAVHRLDVRASLDDPAPAIAQARVEAASGDESWEQWATEVERGEALVIRLDVTVAAEDRSSEPIRTANWGVFVERELHPPQLEQQVAEMASKDYTRIAAQLQERGHDVDAADLAEMYVHVELDPELKKLLTDEEAQRRATRAGDPGAEAGGYEEAISS